MALFIVLAISGCAAAPQDAEVKRMLAGASYSAGWMGVEVAYKFTGLSASHTIVTVVEGTPASKTGLKLGDEIWFIGPDNAGYMNTQEVAKRLREADQQVVLQVKRKGQKGLLSFVLTKNAANSTQQPESIAGSRAGVSSAKRRERAQGNKANIANPSSQRAGLRQQISRRVTTPVDSTSTLIGDPFEIPGVTARDQKASGINELVRVYLEPATGRLAFVGTYNEAYATGAVDYMALLIDAMRSPTPFFSLEPTPASKKATLSFVAGLDQQMARNLASTAAGKAWLTSIFDRLLSDPTLGDDRQRFMQKGADILKVTPAEMPEMIQAMLGRTPQGSPAFIKFMSKFYESAGNPRFAVFMQASARKDVDPDAFMGAIEWLGLEPLRQELRAKVQSGALTTDRGEFLFETAIWKTNFRTMGVPESRWQKTAAYAEATFNKTAFRKMVDEINADLLRERLMEPWLNGLVFSEQFLCRMYQMPSLESEPVYREGLAPNSELARTFLEADWNLKTLTGRPELVKQVPDHLTPHQFLFQRETAAGQYNTSGVEFRLWLKPESAPLSYGSGKRVLAFQTPQVSINAEMLSLPGASPAMVTMIQSGLNEYGKLITRNYDSYAKALPALHRLREAAKVLAFANWARAQGIQLQPSGPPSPSLTLPDRFKRGFWTAHFSAGGNRTFIGFAASGGVDFSPDVGSSWIHAGEDHALGGTALGQLAGSAALGQEAVDAALQGDLDTARTLADQSARAMTGDYNFAGHPALGTIPEASPPEPVLQVELLKATFEQTQQAVTTLAHSEDAGQKARATRQLQQIKAMMATPSPAAEQIHGWVKLLRNGDWDLRSSQVSQPAPQKLVMTSAEEPHQDTLKNAAAIEKERILGEITSLRQDLCRIQSQLRRFNATIQADQAQRGEWEKTVDDAYTSALNRAKAKLAGFSADFPEEKLRERLDTLSDPAERVKVRHALKMVQHLKEAYRVKDFSAWAANEGYGRDEIIEGIGQIVEIIGVEDKIKAYLSKRWGLARVMAFQEAASDLVTSAYDVTAEVVAWQRLAQLNRNSDAFLAAVGKISTHQRHVLAQIHEREMRLGLNPGETKGPCR